MEATPKVYPIEKMEPLEEVKVRPLSTPGVVGGITEDDIKAIQRNMVRTIKWGVINQDTLETINMQAQKK